MQDAKDVAAYILTERGRLTGWQLQKLLYYCQAWSLAFNGERLFPQEILAWDHGPVVPEVFQDHAGAYSIVSTDIKGDASNVDVRYSALIDAVVDSYGDLSGEELEEISHSEDPWQNACVGFSSLRSPEITCDSMRKYYSWLLTRSATERRAHHVPRFTCPNKLSVSDETFDWLASIS